MAHQLRQRSPAAPEGQACALTQDRGGPISASAAICPINDDAAPRPRLDLDEPGALLLADVLRGGVLVAAGDLLGDRLRVELDLGRLEAPLGLLARAAAAVRALAGAGAPGLSGRSEVILKWTRILGAVAH